MGRHCADCDDYRSRSSFSSNQWRKGDGVSRCSDCVNGGGGRRAPNISLFHKCHDCRLCNTQNELNMHRQVHRPRDVACPVCGVKRFRSGANAVQHVE